MKRAAFQASSVVSALLLASIIGLSPAAADTTLTVGKAIRTAPLTIPVDVGYQAGIFKKHGLDVNVVEFSGGSKAIQAMAAGAVDIGDDAGTSLAFVAKGAPMIAVCESSSTIPLLAIGVPADSPAKSAKDLKGKLVGVANSGSLTDWLAQQFSIKEGWGPDGITRVAIGNTPASIAAAFKTHQVDADLSEAGIFYKMEENNSGRLLATSFIHNT
ncbi:MAG TPA: ABC transporter substrate-binding protein [Stellaceae bacterium]|nr:ABC transporter substrate-binding protein [Stellaceae bacterium]